MNQPPQPPRPDEDWGSSTPWQQPTPPQSAAPAQPAQTGMPTTAINSYMVPAILVTLFCFLPTGIAAIVFASQVGSKLAAGDVAGAAKASASAKTWVIVSVAAGLVAWFFILALASSDPYSY